MLKDVPALSFSAVAACVAGAIALAAWPMAILAILLGAVGHGYRCLCAHFQIFTDWRAVISCSAGGVGSLFLMK